MTESSVQKQMCCITISREYGSGGGEIAARLANRLGWKLIDHEVVEQVASVLGVTEEEAEAHDEHSDSMIYRMLAGLNVIATPVPVAMTAMATGGALYNEARGKVVRAAYEAGNAVIVGRGAQVLLGGKRDVLHVRIVAPLEQRITYVTNRESMAPDAARQRIEQKDRDRARFLNNEHHRDPADAQLYDITVNTGVIDLDSATDLIMLALERKGQKLGTPARDLGPGAGLAPYPTAPGNFVAAGGGKGQ